MTVVVDFAATEFPYHRPVRTARLFRPLGPAAPKSKRYHSIVVGKIFAVLEVVLEVKGLLGVAYAEFGTKAQLLRHLAAIRNHADQMLAVGAEFAFAFARRKPSRQLHTNRQVWEFSLGALPGSGELGARRDRGGGALAE